MGERIKAVRLRAGLAQDKFAAALGFSRRAIINWEQDAAEPPIGILAKLRVLYDVDPEWVVLGEDATPSRFYYYVNKDRLERIERDIDLICIDVGLSLKPEQRTALARLLHDGGTDGGEANRKHLRGMLLALSQGG